MAGSKDWIEKATSRNGGKFSGAAKNAGMSTAAYATKTENSPKASAKKKREASLAKTLMSFNKGSK